MRLAGFEAIYEASPIRLHKAGIEKNSNFMMICCFGIAIAGALFLRFTIEIPSLKMRDKVLQSWKQDKILEPAAVSI